MYEQAKGRSKAMNLKGRSFLTLKDFTPEEILYLVDLAEELKQKKKAGITGNSLRGKNIALIFENTLCIYRWSAGRGRNSDLSLST